VVNNDFEPSVITHEIYRCKGRSLRVRATIHGKKMIDVKGKGASFKSCCMELMNVELLGYDVTIPFARAVSPAFFFRGKTKMEKPVKLDVIEFDCKLKSGDRNTAELWNCKNVRVIPFQTGLFDGADGFIEIEDFAGLPFSEPLAV